MPLEAKRVGSTTDAAHHQIEAARAGRYGELVDVSTATRRDDVAHPVFPVCFEWGSVVECAGTDALTHDERLRALHLDHRIELRRPIRHGDRLTTSCTVVVVEPSRIGAYQVLRLDTTDDDGRTVCVSWMGLAYRDVEVVGEARAIDGRPAPLARADGEPDAVVAMVVDADLPRAYSACAGIWNPIHTDGSAARAAGLPGPILHGTAALAMSVSNVLDLAAIAYQDVGFVTALFRGIVLVPSEPQLRIWRGSGRFELVDAEGALLVAGAVERRAPGRASVAVSDERDRA